MDTTPNPNPSVMPNPKPGVTPDPKPSVMRGPKPNPKPNVMPKLSRPARRAVLVVHVTASASWLGLTLGLLALGTTAATTGSAVTVEASVRAMKLFADWLLLPVAFLTLLSGLVLSLGTAWGLARHRWVWTKFWLTLATTTATVFALRPGVNAAVTAVAAGGSLPDAGDVLFGPAVSLSAYVFMTVISVLKPWGPTRRGKRLRTPARRALQDA